MKRNLSSSQQTPDGLQEEVPAETFSSNTLPGQWSSRVFYGISAALHIAAVLALSGSWLLGTVTGNKSASAAPPVPEKQLAARMSIDVGPIKFCEMDIETLIGRPPAQPGHQTR